MGRPENEFSVAASYLRLFRRSNTKTNINTNTNTNNNNNSISKRIDDDDSNSNSKSTSLLSASASASASVIDGEPTTACSSSSLTSSSSQQQNHHTMWTEDHWTVSDEENAQQILDNHVEKCSLVTGAMCGLQIMNPVEHPEREEEEEDSENDATAWDEFYTSHGNRFFKDRHYFVNDFPDEFQNQHPSHKSNDDQNDQETNSRTLVEIGCGVGNVILPLLESDVEVDSQPDANMKNTKWNVIHGLDISKTAIDILSQDPRFITFNKNMEVEGNNKNMTKKNVCYGHVCDISKELALPSVCYGISDVTTLVFCLSAIDPAHHAPAVQNIIATLKPGGVVIFRDYGRYDEAQMKLGTSRSKRLKDSFYQKSDGTKCFYFTIDDVEQLFCRTAANSNSSSSSSSIGSSNIRIIELKYLRRVYYNNKATTSTKAQQQQRRRVWVQGRFQKMKEK